MTFQQLKSGALAELIVKANPAIRKAHGALDNFLHGDLVNGDAVADELRAAASNLSTVATALTEAAALVESTPGKIVETHRAGSGTVARRFP